MSRIEIEKKLCQMIMPRLDFRPGDPLPSARSLVGDFGVGGFLVFGGDTEKVRDAISELKEISDIPLFFSIDAERGVGQIIEGGTLFPHIMSLGASGNVGLAEMQGRVTAQEMLGLGLNLLFAPVVDVNTNPLNPIINVRSFGDDPELVSRLAAAYIRGAQGGGVIACAKHFPGHGSVAVDSHVDLPVLKSGIEELERCDLIPFRACVEAGVGSIMAAHISAPLLDSSNKPATLSHKIIDGLLRKKLGYEGLVISDSFYMDALPGGQTDCAAGAIEAGLDIVLDPREPAALCAELTGMLQRGKLNNERIEKAYERIMKAKQALGGGKQASFQKDIESGKLLCEEIAKSSICMPKMGQNKIEDAVVVIMDVANEAPQTGRVFAQILRERGVEVDVVSLPKGGASGFDMDHFGADKTIIFLVSTAVAAWTENTRLPYGYRTVLEQAADFANNTVLVSLGSPYVIEDISPFECVVVGFDSIPEVEAAAADALMGIEKPRGKLPVNIKW